MDPRQSNVPTASAAFDLGSLILLSNSDAGLSAFASSLLASVDPDDSLERMLAEMVILAATRVRRAAVLESESVLPGLDWCRYQSLAERNFRAIYKDLRQHRERRAKLAADAAGPAPRSKAAPKVDPDFEPTPEPAPPPPPEATPEEIADAYANWTKRIALVKSVSDEWPLILRLRREVEDVTAWLADGKSEEELMSWYPGLTRADIAACRACDEAGLCGPFDTADGPYPPGLPVLDDLPDDPGP